MTSRPEIIDTLEQALRSEPTALAAWLGGSDASGRTDALSDIDLVVIAEDDAIERMFDLAESALAELAPIERMLRFPTPTWHGHEQAIYRLEETLPDLLIDFVVMKQSADNRFLEPERHGTPLVLFDRDRWIASAPGLDRRAHDEKIDQRIEDLELRFALFQCLVTKAIARGHYPEAVQRFVGFTIAPLVEMMRIRSCPHRFDFGLRYLDRDLPDDDRAMIERLVFVHDPDDLRAKHEQAMHAFNATLDAVRAERTVADAG